MPCDGRRLRRRRRRRGRIRGSREGRLERAAGRRRVGKEAVLRATHGRGGRGTRARGVLRGHDGLAVRAQGRRGRAALGVAQGAVDLRHPGLAVAVVLRDYHAGEARLLLQAQGDGRLEGLGDVELLAAEPGLHEAAAQELGVVPHHVVGHEVLVELSGEPRSQLLVRRVDSEGFLLVDAALPVLLRGYRPLFAVGEPRGRRNGRDGRAVLRPRPSPLRDDGVRVRDDSAEAAAASEGVGPGPVLLLRQQIAQPRGDELGVQLARPALRHVEREVFGVV